MRARPIRSLLALGAVLAVAVSAAPLVATADDPPPAKKTSDDTSIFGDWKYIKNRGATYAKERGEFWEGKGTTGKDLIWLGKIWHRGQEYRKAIAKLEDFLKFVPDEKNRETVEKNRELAYDVLMESQQKIKDWAKAVEAAERYRKDFPNGKLLAESWDNQGRYHRMGGEKEKALVAFKNAADMKLRSGIVDLVDVHMAEGRIDEAKATLAKYLEEEIQGKEQYFIPLQTFLGAIGTEGPSLEAAQSVGKDPAPSQWKGKPAVFLNWTLQTPNGDSRLQRLFVLGREFSGKANFAGIMKFVKWNPDTKKVEEDLTPEKETEWMRLFISQSNLRIPPCIALPASVHEGMRQKFEGQMTVLDHEWKFRYMRINDTTDYDIDAVHLAAQRVIEAAPATTPETSGGAPTDGGTMKPPEETMKPPEDR
jgi:tetratricopeptide (TPR) repeat protein